MTVTAFLVDDVIECVKKGQSIALWIAVELPLWIAMELPLWIAMELSPLDCHGVAPLDCHGVAPLDRHGDLLGKVHRLILVVCSHSYPFSNLFH